MADDAHEDSQEEGESPEEEASPNFPDDPTAGVETAREWRNIFASGPWGRAGEGGRVTGDDPTSPTEKEPESDDDPTEGIATGVEWKDASFGDVIKRDREDEVTEAEDPRSQGEESTEQEKISESEPADDPTKGIGTGHGVGDVGDERHDA